MSYYYEERKSLKERMEEKDQLILEVIKKLTKENTHRPTVLEVTKAAGMNSTSTTLQYMRRLKAKGLIEWEPKKPRTLRLTYQKEQKKSKEKIIIY